MIRLDLLEPAWIDDAVDNPADQCAHGKVRLVVNGTPLLEPCDGEFTVSATALHLLRTVELDSTPDAPVADGCQFVPCCAHSLFTAEAARFGFLATGCPNGIELDVTHHGGTVEIVRRDTAVRAAVSAKEWRDAVLGFAVQVKRFYESSKTRLVPDDPDEQRAWSMFWSEWGDRVDAVRQHGP